MPSPTGGRGLRTAPAMSGMKGVDQPAARARSPACAAATSEALEAASEPSVADWRLHPWRSLSRRCVGGAPVKVKLASGWREQLRERPRRK